MNSELVSHVQELSHGCTLARAGDIASLAELLDRCETLRQVGSIHQAVGVQAAAQALAEHLKRMIMDESPDEATDMQALREGVSVLLEALERGEVPGPDAFPVAVRERWPQTDPVGPNGGPGPHAQAGAPAAPASGEAHPDGDSATDAPQPAALAAPASGEVHPQTDLGGDDGAFAADTELLGEYLAEQRGRLEEIEGHLLTLERAVDDGALGGLRRALHTIKGDSGFLGLSQVAQISHAAESYLEAASYPYDLECLFRVKDWLARAFQDLAERGRLSPSTQAALRSLLAELERGTPAEPVPEPTAAEPAAPPEEPPPADAADVAMDVPEDGDTPASELLAELTEPGPEDDPADNAPEAGPLPGEEEPPLAVEPATDAPPAPPPVPEVTGMPADEGLPYYELTADESLLVDFISESKEHLDMASAQLLSLENDPTSEEGINSVFRAFHTVKGIAGFLNLQEISVLAHDTENLLDQVRREEVELSPVLIDLVFEALDWMTRLIGNVRTGLEGERRVTTEPELTPFLGRVRAAQQGHVAPPPPGDRSQRLGEILVESGDVERDSLEQAFQEAQRDASDKKLGEVLVEKELVSPNQVHAALKEQAAPGASSQGPRKAVELKETLRVDYERLENLINTIGELVLAEAMISQDDDILQVNSEALDKKLYNLRQVSRKLQELGTTIRMVPISGTFQKMARLVRDLSRKSGKPIHFHSHGDETELDRAYVDLIADPLVHMIRNAVDHGIEAPAERRHREKPEHGTIDLRAFHQGGNIHVEVRDDGQGLDLQRIRAKALERELITAEEADKLTEQETYQLIFLPGFSTAAQVTEVSGRGVGMDVVRRNITELRGQVQIFSAQGAGTTFKIILPLTLALIDGMLVRVGKERFIFPVLSVVESARPSHEMVNTVIGKGEMISMRGRQLPMYRLDRLFDVPDANEDITQSLVVVVENEGREVGVLVDDLIGIQQTVIKSLGNGLFDAKGMSGGSILADGTVGLIVDVAGLIRMARTSKLGRAEPLN